MSSNLYWKIVLSLVDRGITSAQIWRVVDPDQYYEVIRMKNHGFRIRNLLADARKNMGLTKCALDYMKLNKINSKIEENRIYKLCQINNLSPIKLATFMSKWSEAHNSHLGHRTRLAKNVFWVSGGGGLNSKARYLFDALCKSVPLVRFADWLHCENPFLRCVDSLMIVWDNGKITGGTESIVKSVFAGEYVCIPAPKPYLKFEMFTKPVLLWGDEDCLCVHHRDFIDMDAIGRFEPLIYKVVFRADASELDDISVEDVYGFIQWGNEFGVIDDDMILVVNN